MGTTRARGGVAAAALGGILVITISWWALALWPVGAAVPEWVLRTRAICFGARSDGLPDAVGWLWLVGEPVGMIGVLVAVWGDALRRDLARLRTTWGGRAVLGAAALVLMAGGLAAVQRIRGPARPAAILFDATAAGTPAVDERAPALALVDQRGAPFTLDSLRGRRVMLTFAFSHCETICPTIVHDLQVARRDAASPDAALVVVTLDPWRDVPARLPSIAAAWGLGGDDRALSGSVDDVGRVLDAWGVARARDGQTGQITHAATVLLIDRDGHVRYRLVGAWERAGQLLRAL